MVCRLKVEIPPIYFSHSLKINSPVKIFLSGTDILVQCSGQISGDVDTFER